MRSGDAHSCLRRLLTIAQGLGRILGFVPTNSDSENFKRWVEPQICLPLGGALIGGAKRSSARANSAPPSRCRTLTGRHLVSRVAPRDADVSNQRACDNKMQLRVGMHAESVRSQIGAHLVERGLGAHALVVFGNDSDPGGRQETVVFSYKKSRILNP